MGVWAVSLLTDQLSPTSLTTRLNSAYSEFDWLREIAPPRTIQCSTPQVIPSAIP